VSWSLSVGPVAQGAARDACEEARDRQGEQVGGFSDEVRAQQDAAFDAVDLVLAKAEFHGHQVSCSLSGHVDQGTPAPDTVSVYITAVK
jgi:hypothetical protein